MREKYRKISSLLMYIYRRRRQIGESTLAALDIQPSQHFVLMQLSHSGPMASQAQIAERMDVSAASVARTLKNLDDGGYITRADGRTDSRRNEIAITPKGEAVVEASRAIFMGVDHATYEGFTEGEFMQLEKLFGKMIGNLSMLEQSEKEMKQD